MLLKHQKVELPDEVGKAMRMGRRNRKDEEEDVAGRGECGEKDEEAEEEVGEMVATMEMRNGFESRESEAPGMRTGCKTDMGAL